LLPTSRDWPPHRLDDDGAMAEHRLKPPEYHQGYEQGVRDEQDCLMEKDERNVPPWLRRFFWHDKESFGEGWRIPWVSLPRTNGHDEWCNPVAGIRLRGGVLYVRTGRRVRFPSDGPCPECLRGDADE
jgi:hypothetical protein